MSSPRKVLVARPDRLGDVLLSTPAFEVLARAGSAVTVLVRAEVAPVIQGLPSVQGVILFDPSGRHAGLRGLFALAAEIRAHRFDAAVALQSRRAVAWAIRLAGVPLRAGPLGKPHSFLLYNRGLRQHRSRVEMHEADYSLQLLERLGVPRPAEPPAPRAHVAPAVREQARQWLAERGWRPGTALVAVHPGMGGSALNWPEARYAETIRALLREGRQVLVTAGPAEGALLERIGAALGDLRGRTLFYGGAEARPIDFMAALLSWVDLVIAPSTGPLHLAVAIGKPVVCFYAPIRVQSRERWGPYGVDPARAAVLVPQVDCGQTFSCRGAACPHYPCMETLTVERTLAEVRRLLPQG
jgi:ADP-heptose:LPS heptosyltransferase